MNDLQSLVAPTFNGLADLLASSPHETWDAPSLCQNWQVRNVIARDDAGEAHSRAVRRRDGGGRPGFQRASRQSGGA